jgi:hypothetical protein
MRRTNNEKSRKKCSRNKERWGINQENKTKCRTEKGSQINKEQKNCDAKAMKEL